MCYTASRATTRTALAGAVLNKVDLCTRAIVCGEKVAQKTKCAVRGVILWEERWWRVCCRTSRFAAMAIKALHALSELPLSCRAAGRRGEAKRDTDFRVNVHILCMVR